MRQKLEERMLAKGTEASGFSVYLAKMRERAEVLWPKEESRIPFYERKWLERQLIE